jgi:hypothetical protein
VREHDPPGAVGRTPLGGWTGNVAFAEFHNAHHRYAVHKGATPEELWSNSRPGALSSEYRVPTSLPARGRIEVVRYVRSNRIVDLFGRRITVAEEHAHQYVTAFIKVRSRRVIVATIDGEVIHDGPFPVQRTLR